MICWKTLISLNILFIVLVSSLPGPLDVALSWAKAQKIPFDINVPWLQFENETRCYGNLGCLTISKDWYHLLHRPFNIFPLPRSTIGTKFLLYTDKNPIKGHLLNAEDVTSIQKSSFNSSHPTKFIIHGFIDTPLSNWISEMRDELLKRKKTNVIVVNWAGGSLPLYTQATANTRLVALEIAYIIKTLERTVKLDLADVHLIGHSLGAHTAGYVGQEVPGIGRITGLDPAEPYFQGMGSIVRLDPSDAHFVDVIHTDGRGFSLLEINIPGYGMSEPCGHIDFYPNNGKEQPGCLLSGQGSSYLPLTLIKNGVEEASRVLLACNHIRAVKLFTDSINGKCSYIAHRCPTYDHFIAGHCFKCQSNNCAVMGIDTFNNTSNEILSNFNNGKLKNGKYFLMTGKDYPYCQRHYRYSIKLGNPKESEPIVYGHLTAKITNSQGYKYEIELTKGNVNLEHGSTYQTVISHDNNLDEEIKSIELIWTHDANMLIKSLCLLWCNDHLYVKSISIDTMKFQTRRKRLKDASQVFYPRSEYAELENYGNYLFFQSN